MSTLTGLSGIGELIECRPEYREGRPHIAGTGVSVATIGWLWQQGLSAETIKEDLPALELDQIHAALAFYLHNRVAIDADVKRQNAEYDEAVEAQRRARARGDRSLG